MQATDSLGVLDAEDLREIDEVMLDYLREGRVTPVYCQKRILDEGVRNSITAQYCQQRLSRLEEHNHLENLFDTGLYELVDDPREDMDD